MFIMDSKYGYPNSLVNNHFPRSSAAKHGFEDKNVTVSVHIITGNSRGVWGSMVSETARMPRPVTLAGLVSQADRGQGSS